MQRCKSLSPAPLAIQSLSSKVALITGGISGLGYATALRFARAGASVAMLDVTPAGDVKVSVPGGLYVQADVRSEDDVRAVSTRGLWQLSCRWQFSSTVPASTWRG
jgi:hypothetical protein